jgi:anti-anti-sigma factor
LNVTVDMRETSAIDSSALGMLLNMKRFLNKSDKEIKIKNCNQVVKKVFQITNFNQKFTIE